MNIIFRLYVQYIMSCEKFMFKRIIYVKPSMFKFTALLKTTAHKILKNLANFILKASELRQTMSNAI